MPAGLTASAPSPNRVNLSWNASTDNVGVTGYEIFRDGSLVATTASTSYTDTAVSANTTYSYQVRARDAAGNRSTLTSSVGVTTPPDLDPPSTPLSLAATVASASRIDLRWNASTDNVGVTGYEIFRDGVLHGTSAGTTYADTATQAGTTYTYQVRARDAAGNRSAFGNTVTVTTPYTFTAVADAYVRQADPNTNYGSATSLIVDSSPVFESYLKFTVSNVSGVVRSAKVRLYVTNGSPGRTRPLLHWKQLGRDGHIRHQLDHAPRGDERRARRQGQGRERRLDGVRRHAGRERQRDLQLPDPHDQLQRRPHELPRGDQPQARADPDRRLACAGVSGRPASRCR